MDKFKQLTKVYNDFFNAYENFTGIQQPKYVTNEHISNGNKWLNKLKKSEFPIVFRGGYSTGKSTIVNALLERIILSSKWRAETDVPVIIKKGDKDSAIVYSYIKEIGEYLSFRNVTNKLNFDLNSGYTIEDLFSTLQENGDRIDDTEIALIVEEIKKLYNKESVEVGIVIDIDDVNKYTSSIIDEDAIHIYGKKEKIVVEIKCFPDGIDEDIVIVDLPGKGSFINDHDAVTKEFTEEEAKVLIMCFMPEKTQDDDYFLESNANAPIVKRAFWLINQMDKNNSPGFIKSVEENLYNAILNYGIQRPNEDRIYKISALAYLHNKLVTKTDLSNSERKWLEDTSEEVEVDGIIRFHNESSLKNEFKRFKDSLLLYIRTKVKEDFYDDARYVLINLLDVFKNELPKTTKNQLEITEKYEFFQYLNEQLKTVLSESSSSFANLNKESIVFDEIKNKYETKIAFIIKGQNKDFIREEMSNIEDIIVNPYALGSIALKLNLLSHFRSLIEKLLLQSFYSQYTEPIYNYLNKNLIPFLDSDSQKIVNQKFGKETFIQRLKGICDCLFVDYSSYIYERLNEATNNISTKTNSKNGDNNKTTKQDIVIDLYKLKSDEGIAEFLEELKKVTVEFLFDKDQKMTEKKLRNYLQNFLNNYKNELNEFLLEFISEKNIQTQILRKIEEKSIDNIYKSHEEFYQKYSKELRLSLIYENVLAIEKELQTS